jgi:DNA-binding FadR family transcriptional regulator
MQETVKQVERSTVLYRSVQDFVKNYILDNNLRAGDPLPPETELSRQLGVSRNSVREAVKALESLGVLETRHGSGLFVREFSFEPLLENLPYALLFDLQQLADLQEVRRLLEVGIIEDALQTMTDQQTANLQGVIEKMHAQAKRGQSVFEEDREFHRVLFQHLDNQVLSKLLDIFWETFHKAAILTDVERDADPMRNYRNHAAILEAIQARDVAQARSALHQHYTDFESRLRRAQQTQEITTE